MKAYWTLIPVVLCFPCLARADIITYSFSGFIHFTINVNEDTSTVPVGTPFSGVFNYDNAAPLTGSGGNFADFTSSIASISSHILSFSQGGLPPLLQTTYHSVVLGFPGVPSGPSDVMSAISFDLSRSDTNFAALYFVDINQTVFASALSLPSALPLSAFEYIGFQTFIRSPGGGGLHLFGFVNNITAVPEPSSLLLIGFGLGVFGSQRLISKGVKSMYRRSG